MSDNARKFSLSFTVGRGSLDHNTRENTNNYNVDTSKIKDNIVLVNDDIEKVYNELFSKELEEYNAKQKRKDRRIDNYYLHEKEKMSKAINQKTKNKVATHYEIIVQVGNKDEVIDNETAKKIYKEYYEKFIEENKNMRVFQAIIHLDESTPHIHIDYVPWAEKTYNVRTKEFKKYSKGLSKQVALNNAIYQMGYETWNDWKDKNFQLLEEIAKDHNIYRKLMYDTSKHMNIRQFKELKANEDNKQKNTGEIKIDIDEPEKEVIIKYLGKNKLDELKIKAIKDERKIEYKVFGGEEKLAVKASEYNSLLDERNSLATKLNEVREKRRNQLISIKNDIEERDEEWRFIVQDKITDNIILEQKNKKLEKAFSDISTQNKLLRNKSYVKENAKLSSEVDALKASVEPLKARIRNLQQELENNKASYSKGYDEGENRGYREAMNEVVNEWDIDEFQSLIDVRNAEIRLEKIRGELNSRYAYTEQEYKDNPEYIKQDENFYNTKHDELDDMCTNTYDLENKAPEVLKDKIRSIRDKIKDIMIDIKIYALSTIESVKDKINQQYNQTYNNRWER